MSGNSSDSMSDGDLSEFVLDPADLAEDEEESAERTDTKPKRRYGIPEKWSRIISLQEDDLSQLMVYEIGRDRIAISGKAYPPSDRRNKEWQPYFCPRTFVKNLENITLDRFRLSKTKLKALGIQVSNLRTKYRKQVMEMKNVGECGTA